MTTETTQTDTKNAEKILKSASKISKKEISISIKRDNSNIKKIVKFHGDYIQMFSTTMFEYMVSYNLSRSDLLVLFGYCSLLEYGNVISISQADVAKKIGIAQPNVARSVKKLKDVGIFYSTPEAPRSLYIHPAFIAKGDLAQFKDQILDWELEKRGKKAEKIENKEEKTQKKQQDQSNNEDQQDQIETKKDDDLPF